MYDIRGRVEEVAIFFGSAIIILHHHLHLASNSHGSSIFQQEKKKRRRRCRDWFRCRDFHNCPLSFSSSGVGEKLPPNLPSKMPICHLLPPYNDDGQPSSLFLIFSPLLSPSRSLPFRPWETVFFPYLFPSVGWKLKMVINGSSSYGDDDDAKEEDCQIRYRYDLWFRHVGGVGENCPNRNGSIRASISKWYLPLSKTYFHRKLSHPRKALVPIEDSFKKIFFPSVGSFHRLLPSLLHAPFSVVVSLQLMHL